jgi:hypothetical protein
VMVVAVACLSSAASQAQSVGTATPVTNSRGTGAIANNGGYLPALNGAGFRLSDDGRSVLHLGIDAAVGFDTNPYVVPLAKTNELGSDAIIRLRPRAGLDVSGSLLSFRGAAQLDWGFLPGLLNPRTRSFLLYQGLLGGDLEINRGGAFSFAVGDSLTWINDPGVTAIGTLLNRIHNQLRAGVGIKPGGGTLQFRITYAFDFVKYLDVPFDLSEGGLLTSGELDTLANTLSVRADYRFLPKTGFFALVSAGWQTYPFALVQQSGFPINIQIGVQGQLLPRLAGLASLGYSNPLILSEAGIDTAGLIGVVGQLEVQWSPSSTTQLAAGFQRSFSPAPLYQFTGNNRLYANFNQVLLQRFVLNVGAGYSIVEYGKELAPDQNLTDRNDFGQVNGPGNRLDGQLDGQLRLAYFFVDWFSVGINNTLTWRVTNASDVTQNVSTNLSYFRNETLLVGSIWY